MSYRRGAGQVDADRAWSRFVDEHRDLVAAAGLPALAVESSAHFDDLLMHGHFDHHSDPTSFTTDSLADPQYRALVELVENYFAAGFGWYTPMALRPADLQRLQARFAHGE